MEAEHSSEISVNTSWYDIRARRLQSPSLRSFSPMLNRMGSSSSKHYTYITEMPGSNTGRVIGFPVFVVFPISSWQMSGQYLVQSTAACFHIISKPSTLQPRSYWYKINHKIDIFTCSKIPFLTLKRQKVKNTNKTEKNKKKRKKCQWFRKKPNRKKY